MFYNNVAAVLALAWLFSYARRCLHVAALGEILLCILQVYCILQNLFLYL